MSASAPQIGAERASDGTPKGRSLAEIVVDGRTRESKRRHELAAMYTRALGGSVDEVTANRIAVAAEMATASEAARARFLRGDPSVSINDLVRLERLAAAAEKRLGVGVAQPKRSGPTLAEYLAGRSQAAAA